VGTVIDPRIRLEHVSRYGATDAVEAYLRVLENIPPVAENTPGDDHHMLARSTWPKYANLKVNPWNRLRVHRGVHTALTELQSRFEDRLRVAVFMMKGQSLEASLDSKRRGGRLGGKIGSKTGKRASGRRAVESGQLASIRSREASVKGGTITGRRNVESGHMIRLLKSGANSRGGKTQGKKNIESGHLARMRHIRWHIKRPGGFNPNCKLCFKVI
jgi:hypothetical protein